MFEKWKTCPNDESFSVIYLAYGSNLNTEQMSFRCPGAVIYDAATLQDYELVFRGSPLGAFASIEPHPGGSVPVLIWEVSRQNIAALDIYEGFPLHYRKETLKCTALGREIHPFAYIMNETIGPYNLPSKTYFQTIYEGYKEFRFDTDTLCDAVYRSYLKSSVMEVNYKMTETIREEILAVRDTGAANMLDLNAVEYIAYHMNYFDLVNYPES